MQITVHLIATSPYFPSTARATARRGMFPCYAGQVGVLAPKLRSMSSNDVIFEYKVTEVNGVTVFSWRPWRPPSIAFGDPEGKLGGLTSDSGAARMVVVGRYA